MKQGTGLVCQVDDQGVGGSSSGGLTGCTKGVCGSSGVDAAVQRTNVVLCKGTRLHFLFNYF